jgi:ribose transport system ATP-binding protein
VQNLNQGKRLKDISFFARRGEIVGFYGLMGSGRTETMRALFGADSFDTGVVKVSGKPVKIKSCKDAKNRGFALLTEDRKNHGLILSFSVKDNIVLANLNNVMGPAGLSAAREDAVCSALSETMRIKTPSLRQKVNFLSGGNQQKVVIAKWLNSKSDIIIFDEPTRGIDVGAKVEIYKVMNQLKEEGKAIIMVSSELPETIGVSDRIYVMHDGRIKKCFEKTAGLTESDIMKYATGTADDVKGCQKLEETYESV